MDSTISAIILSAGSSRRMGEPKALLQIGEKTFLQHIIDTVESAGIQNIVVVLGHEWEIIQEQLPSFSGKIVINEKWEQGQLTSIISGVNVLNDCDGVLIWPIDHPLISPALIGELLDSFRKKRKQIVVPTFEGRRGHPIIISSTLFDEIKHASLEIGLREVVHAHQNEIIEVPVTEEGIRINIDTPEDYEKYIG